MTQREALASMTIWAAYANFQERLIGSIAPGKYADFVVMDRDWMTAAPEEIEKRKSSPPILRAGGSTRRFSGALCRPIK